jgi:UDP-glucuronate 4-epimerase
MRWSGPDAAPPPSRICITGGLGFVGTRLCRALLDQGRSVRCVDSLVGRYGHGTGPEAAAMLAARGAEVVRAHVGVAPDDLVLNGADAVIHLAGLPGVRTRRPFAELFRENALATERLARAAAERGARLVLASTSSVYGDATCLPTPEHAAPAPLGAYARSKLAAERACLGAVRERGADAVIARLFTVYGPGQRPDMAFARWIRGLGARRALPWRARYEAVRDFTYVDDAVAGLIAALDRGRPGETYNVSGHAPVAVREALALIEQAVGRRAVLDRLPASRSEARATAGCPLKAAAELGYVPRTPLATGIERQIAAERIVASPGPPPAEPAQARAARPPFGWESRAAARGWGSPRPAAPRGAATGRG